jgi:hypothetical protein
MAISSRFPKVVLYCGLTNLDLQAEKRRRAAADAKRAEAALLETKKKIHALTGEPMDEDLPESNGLANGLVGVTPGVCGHRICDIT